jgi:hypothetical protein
MAASIRPSNGFVCPKTEEKIDIDKCVHRYVTANTLGKEYRLCLNCQYGAKNRKRLAASLDEAKETNDNGQEYLRRQRLKDRERFSYTYYES